MMPKVGMLKELKDVKVDEKEINRVVAIIDSMTPHERDNHMIINGSRRRRIAKGSGTSVQEVNQLLKQYAQARKMMKTFSGGFMGKKLGKMKLPPGFPFGDLPGGRRADKILHVGVFDADDSPGAFRRQEEAVLPRVVIEKERARNGRNLEVVGHYNPLTNPAQVLLKHDRIEYWTKNGAQLSDTVKRLVEKNPAAAAATRGLNNRSGV